MGIAAVAGWYFSLLMTSVLLSWLFNRTGSVFLPAIFHGTMDVAFTAPGTPFATNVLGALVTIWGVAVAILSGSERLSALRPAPGSDGARKFDVGTRVDPMVSR